MRIAGTAKSAFNWRCPCPTCLLNSFSRSLGNYDLIIVSPCGFVRESEMKFVLSILDEAFQITVLCYVSFDSNDGFSAEIDSCLDSHDVLSLSGPLRRVG